MQIQDQQQELNLLKETVEKSFIDMKGTITKHVFSVEKVLVGTLINECGKENMLQVNDLPKLYTKINTLFELLKIFNEDQLSNLGEKLMKHQDNIGMAVANIPLNNYYTEYEVKVQALNNVGEGPESEAVVIYGCKKWDTCGPEAVLEAEGGILTDLRGQYYSYANEVEHANRGGVLAATNKTCHEDIIRKMPSHIFEAIQKM
uniref:3'(2'),5'-bisphosphate nucleotidase 1 n=1 Tax=Glossina austeni TaxID=7395 RepID=A0A1A9VMB2_GLOAU